MGSSHAKSPRTGGGPAAAQRHDTMLTQRTHVLVFAASPHAAGQACAAALEASLEPVVATTCSEALQKCEALKEPALAAVVACDVDSRAVDWLLAQCKRSLPRTFAIVHNEATATDVRARLDCFDAGAMMVTPSGAAVGRALRTVASVLSSGGTLSCHRCGLGGLSGDALRRHLQFHHQTHPRCASPPRCPLCDVRLGRTPLACHLMQEHGPPEEREPSP